MTWPLAFRTERDQRTTSWLRPLDADAQDKSRSQLLRELADDAVNEHQPNEDDEYRPSDDTLDSVYQAAFNHANTRLGLRFDLTDGQMASETGIAATALRGSLLDLEQAWDTVDGPSPDTTRNSTRSLSAIASSFTKERAGVTRACPSTRPRSSPTPTR
ncbi:hypothetical protein [Salarchaeum sp. JOR-1]|uniref:hypothetical protein n=1 Tax=Salarchaeum sp. JOR-1 TaxID=2599399 RepID=UPI0011983FBB|nr:hypothetical protein [Salarchaeum sp. JOR-1]QDX41299.1 hypothetical protein FQU85_10465 [Salarchaeum sp. JOR-1]